MKGTQGFHRIVGSREQLRFLNEILPELLANIVEDMVEKCKVSAQPARPKKGTLFLSR